MDTKFICLSFLFGLVSLVSNGQTFPVSAGMEEGYYVVIGVYDAPREPLAMKYAASRNARTGFHSPKNRLYVYTFFTEKYQDAITQMRAARQDVHPEAWVFVCRTPTATVNLAGEKVRENLPEVVTETGVAAEQLESTGEGSPDMESEQQEHAGGLQSIEDIGESLENRTHVAFLLSNARNNAEVNGEVQIIDTERARLSGVIPSGEVVELKDPGNGTGRITAIADIFGYRKQQLELDYQRLFDNEQVNKLSDYYVIFFDLIRYHKGDIATMYNVYFFNDAAVMRPESRYEINSLLEMMRENPGYRIKIHGHTNGGRAGKIISRGDGDPFFALVDTNREKIGSAKALSRERATIIRDYLISQGIDSGRMEIKAWGGRRMLYDKNGSQARKNVRVEIEILEE